MTAAHERGARARPGVRGALPGPHAPWGTRAAAWLTDYVGVVLGSVAVGFVSDALANVAVVVGVAVLGYLDGSSGQSPGKRLFGLHLVGPDGGLLGGRRGVGRKFLHVLDTLPLALGWLWPLWDRENQTFADKLVGSVVVSE